MPTGADSPRERLVHCSRCSCLIADHNIGFFRDAVDMMSPCCSCFASDTHGRNVRLRNGESSPVHCLVARS